MVHAIYVIKIKELSNLMTFSNVIISTADNLTNCFITCVYIIYKHAVSDN